MANEENTVTKVVEGVDKLFSQIVLNGEVVSDTRPVSTSTPHTSSSTPRNRNTPPVQGEYVKAVQLNNTLHDFKDESLTQTVSTIQENLATAQEDIDTIESKIPSEASDQNQLADKSFVGTSIENAINELDVPSVGGSGKYIKSIRQVDGKIEAVEDNLTATGGLAFTGTRAQYEQAKLIPEGQIGHIPSGTLVCITDENRTYETSRTGAEQTLSLIARVMSAGDGITITNDDAIKADTVIFTGTRAEWEALSTAQKAKFNIVNITDEELTDDVITDTVEVGNMKAVTSNAVAEALSIGGFIKSVELTNVSTDSAGNAWLGLSFSDIIPLAFSPINYGAELVTWQFAIYSNGVYLRCSRTSSTISGTLYYIQK